MADAKRKLLIEILSDAKGVKQGFGEAESATGSLGKKLVGAAVAVGAVTVGVDLMKDALGEAVKDEASVSALAQQMKNLGIPEKDQKSAEAFIGKLSLMRGVADDELRPAFAQLVRSFGDVTKAQTNLSLAQDIAAARGVSVAEAADLLAKANNGQTKGLKALGIGLTDINGKALTSDEIFKKLHATFDGAGDAAANTGAGKLKKMTVGFDEMKEKIGYALLPVMEKLVDFITNTLIPAAEGFGKFLADHKPILIAFATIVGVTLVSAFAAWAVSAATAAAATVAAMAPVLIPIAAIAAAAYLIYKNWDSIAKFFEDLWQKVSDAFNNKWIAIAALVIAPMIAIPIEIAKHWQGLVDFFTGAWDFISGIFENKWGRIAALVIAPIIGIPVLIAKNWDGLVEFFHGVWQGIEKVFATGASIVFDVWDTVWKAVSTVVGGYVDGIKVVISGLWTGIKFIINPIITALNAVITVYDKFAKTFNDSPLPGPTFPIFGKIDQLAKGGIVTRPTLALIGEAGPEAVVPLNGRNGMGTVTNNIVINLSDMDGSKLVAVLKRYTQQNGPGWMGV